MGIHASGSVLCVGRLYCDLVFTGTPHLPRLGEEVFAEGLSLHAGGGAFITAATLAALGRSAALCAMLPAPPFEAIVKDKIIGAGVDDSFCQPACANAVPQVTVAMPCESDRAFLSHLSGAAIPDVLGVPSHWKHLHIGELRSLVEHPELVEFARSGEMSMSLDCGWDSELLADGAGVAALIESVDVFLPNEAEFSRLVNSGLSETAAPLTVIKCGASGSRALSKKRWVKAAATPVDVVDATGAGDAFNGGFLNEWLENEAIDACLDAGNLCGAAAVQGVGGTSALGLIKARVAE